jgi:hypothetical protein
MINLETQGSEFLTPYKPNTKLISEGFMIFAEFDVAGFRFSDTFLQYWGLKPSEITLVFWLRMGQKF